MIPDKRLQLSLEPIVWTGDLDDDCTARWAGLMLRAEWMNKRYWWWAVYDMENKEETIDSANEYTKKFTSGTSARNNAERVARQYMEDLKQANKAM